MDKNTREAMVEVKGVKVRVVREKHLVTNEAIVSITGASGVLLYHGKPEALVRRGEYVSNTVKDAVPNISLDLAEEIGVVVGAMFFNENVPRHTHF